MPYSEQQLTDIVYAAVEKVLMESRKFDGDRNALDAFKQSRVERAEILDTVKAIPGDVLFGNRDVNGRNEVDRDVQLRADLLSIKPGNIDVQAIAAAIAEQLPKADAEALIDALAARLTK